MSQARLRRPHLRVSVTKPEEPEEQSSGGRGGLPPPPPPLQILSCCEPSSYSEGERSSGPLNKMELWFTGWSVFPQDRRAVCQWHSAQPGLEDPRVGLTPPPSGSPDSPGSQDRTKNVKCHTLPLVYLHLTGTTFKFIEGC